MTPNAGGQGRKTFRVYLTTQHDGRLTGVMMRSKESWFDTPAPSAYGASEEHVLEQLEGKMFEEVALGRETERYLWDETFQTRRVSLEVNSGSMIETMPVVGRRVTPLRLWFAWSKHESGAFRVMLPRYGWWLLFEDLDDVGPIMRTLVASSLTAKEPTWVYRFGEQGEERVLEWTPETLLSRLPKDRQRKENSPPPELSKVGEELTERAKRKKLPLVVGEDEHSTELAEIIKAGPRPILLVGEPGVGKTSVIRRVATLLSRDKDAPKLWASSAERILGGMVYLGMWQERCLNLVKELGETGDWLFVDRLSSFVRSMSDGSSLMDAMSAAISSREFGFISECTPSELVQARRALPSLIDQFQIIEVLETAPAKMRELMHTYQLRKRSPAILSPPSVALAVSHLDRYVRASRFPGKGFLFLDWLHRKFSGPDRGSDGSSDARASALSPADVTHLFSEYSGLPLRLVDDRSSLPRADIAQELRQRVIGQDPACEVSSKVLARFKAGMTDPDRPIGSLFFVGPTGVGKTELAKELARFTFGDRTRLLRFDMAEYGHPGSSGRLTQVGDGVTSLATGLSKQPMSVVLFDEIEKAHPEVFDLLLGVLGEGRLTDSDGRLVDARSSVFIMTSNLGSGDSRTAGFGEPETPKYDRAVRSHFRPEFFNRIDHVVSFAHLTEGAVKKIVELELDAVGQRDGLVTKGLKVAVSGDAKNWLAKNGYHNEWGARPLRRLIEQTVVAQIAVYLSESPNAENATLNLVLKNDKLVVEP